MKKCVVLICCVVVFSGAVQAGLWNPALLNPSFESVEDGGTAGGWGYIIDDWYENEYGGSNLSNYYEQASGIALVGDGLLWAGVENGGRFYQPIGNYDGEETITVTLLLGARGGTFGTGVISLYAGGLEGDAADTVDLPDISGVVQLDTINVVPADGTEVSTNVYEVTVELLTGTSATTGDLLWLEFGSSAKDYFDNITIKAEAFNKALLVYPTPSGAGFVPTDAKLKWGSPPITPNYYDLWFGDPNVLSPLGWTKKLDKQNQTEYDPPNGPGSGNMAFKTTYYWRVDAYEPNTVGDIFREGNMWSFTTAPDLPIILSQPQSVTVAASDTAVITVGGVNLTTAQWYKDGGIMTGETSTTLTIGPPVLIGDEAAYHCVVGDGNPAKDVPSDSARLWTKRLIGHWEFEDDLTDEVGDWPGIFVDPNTDSPLPPPVAVYEPNGVYGKALELSGIGIVLISDSNEFFNFYPLGYTVSAWVKNPNAGWGALAGKQNRGRTPDRGWVLNHNDDTASSTLRQTAVQDYGAAVGLMDGDWHIVTGVFDPNSANDKQIKCYVDGQLVADSGTEVISGITGSVAHMVIGAEGPDGASPLTGLLDDVRLYSYNLPSFEVLGLYGTPIISEHPQNQTISAGQIATLTVSVYSNPVVPETGGYVWYKDDVAVSGGKYSGEDSNTLTVNDFQAGEEGAYYCEATNSNATVTSETANLILPQLVAHWTFDTGDNLNDTVGSNHGTAFGASGPTYDPSGIVGDQALVLDGTEPNDVVVVPYAYGLNSTQFTVTLWAKVAGGSETYRTPICSRSEDGTQTYGFNLYASNGDTWEFWSGTPDALAWQGIGSAPVVEDEWAYLVMTYDATTQLKQLYVNGELDGEQTVPLPVNPLPNALQIGGNGNSATTTGAIFNGSIDDVKVYGYVLGAYDIAEEYVGIVPTASVCPDTATGLDYDYDGDCDVDIADFALFAAKLGNCNRVTGTGSVLLDCK